MLSLKSPYWYFWLSLEPGRILRDGEDGTWEVSSKRGNSLLKFRTVWSTAQHKRNRKGCTGNRGQAGLKTSAGRGELKWSILLLTNRWPLFFSCSEEPSQFFLRFLIPIERTSLSNHHYQVIRAADLMFMQAKEFPHVPLHPIPKSRRACLFFDHNPQTVKGMVISLYKDDKIPTGRPSPRFHRPPEILRSCDPLLLCKPERPFHAAIIDRINALAILGIWGQTANLFLPFSRLRFKTSRPLFVLILSKKPWVRFRLRLLGWYVLFIESLFLRVACFLKWLNF